MPLTLVSGPRLPVDRVDYWRCVAVRAADTVPAELRQAVAVCLEYGYPECVETQNAVAELMIRGCLPGQLSFATGRDVALLSIMALDFGHLNGATAAYTDALLQELEGECQGR